MGRHDGDPAQPTCRRPIPAELPVYSRAAICNRLDDDYLHHLASVRRPAIDQKSLPRSYTYLTTMPDTPPASSPVFSRLRNLKPGEIIVLVLAVLLFPVMLI